MKRAILYITNGIIFLVSFIALYGLLLEASSATRALWELLYLVIGIALLQSIAKSRRAIFANAVFYAVNIFLAILYEVVSNANNLFLALTLMLLALGCTISIANIKSTRKLSYLPVDAIAIDGKTVAETDAKTKAAKKTVKKKAKKTVKKKVAKKAKKKAKKKK